ncbi:hypothetical protein ACHAWT_004761 [Skeletonema menzelii]
MTRIGKRKADDTSYKIGNMILSLSAKNIFIFSALVGGVLATNNLRELKTRHNGDQKHEMAASSYHGPSITLDKESYAEGEDITVSFSVGRPNDPFFSSSDAPSLNLDFNYPKWRIGLFMRDADPQGGSLDPIVGINLCGAVNCDPNNLDFKAYTSKVTFGSEFESFMEGQWPVKMNDYGQGLDAYVLDANGAAAIGPFEFEIHSTEKPKPKKLSGLAKYNHADLKDTSRKHTGINKAANTAAKLHDTNGLVSSLHVPSHSKDTKTLRSTDTSFKKNSISAEKNEYQEDEPISINFSLHDIFKNEDKSEWRVAFFAGSTGPHGGDVDPIVSIPICGEKECADLVGTTDGQVTFGRKTTEAMKGSWPINFDQWGNEFNVFVLDDSGATILGPGKISVLSNEYA